MDCEYVLVCKWGTTEIQRPILVRTLEEAENSAQLIVNTYQNENLNIAKREGVTPQLVTGQLYRLIEHLNGNQFIARRAEEEKKLVIEIPDRKRWESDFLDDQFN